MSLVPCFTVPTSKLNKRKEGRQERKGREMRREIGGEGREEGGERRKEENIATETSTTQSTAEEAPVHK